MTNKALAEAIVNELRMMPMGGSGLYAHTNDLTSAILPLIEQYGKDLAGESWISVEDELPDDGQYVLCYSENIIHSPTKERITMYSVKYGFESAVRVTHWQPLPAPPNRETYIDNLNK